MANLKPKEQRVLDYLKAKIEEKGYAPSVREICADLNIKSTSTAHMYIERLANKGCIIRESGKSRTIIMAESEEAVQKSGNNYEVPVIGQVAAGVPILTAENFDGYMTFSTSKKYDPDTLFALHVKGESMKDIGILASLDPVAIDQACLDLVYASDDPGRDHLIERIETRNGTLTPKAAEQLGMGSRQYELIEIE